MRIQTYEICRLLIGICIYLSTSVAIAEEQQSAAISVVEELHAALISVMKDSATLGYQERYDQLKPVIELVFDTSLIAQVVLSRYWKELSEQQQTDFIKLFNRLSISTYASRFDSYSDEVFETKNVQELKKGRLLVQTELIRSNDKPVSLDYLMHKKDDRWYIISVIADGVNDLSLKRAEYATIIKDSGFNKLVSDIEEKIRNNG